VTFAHPAWLLLLPAVASLGVAYLLAQRRRPRFTVRFTSLDLLERVATEQPRWRRHLPPGLALLGLAALATAAAGPAVETTTERSGDTVILALDVSPSMMARDVAPSRFAAAQAAVERFVEVVPPRVDVGLVSFAGSARLDVPPTSDRGFLVDAVERLEFRSETSLAEALRQSAAAARLGSAGEGESAQGALILLSDGGSTVGPPEAPVVDELRASGLAVSTVAFGTDAGTVTLGGETVPVPADPDPLRRIAEATGGQFIEATTGQELLAAYTTLGSSTVTVPTTADVSRFLLLAAALLLAGAGVLAQRWFGRVV
jgi:Ca-activated chloride channel family protein